MSALIPGLAERLEASEEFAAVERRTAAGVPVCVHGVSGGGSALLIAGLLGDGPALIATYNDERARRIADDLHALLGEDDGDAQRRVLVYPSIASALYDGVTPGRDEIADRLTVLDRLCADEPVVVVASVPALLLRTIPRELMLSARREVRPGDVLDRDDLGLALVKLGYERVDLVDGVGQFSVRGGIIDVYAPTMPQPVRIELFDDEVESIRIFDTETQVSLQTVERAGFGPAGEVLLDEQAVAVALPQIERAFRKEIDRLIDAGKRREAERLRERRGEDIEAIEQLRPSDGLIHYMPYLHPERQTLGDYLPDECLVVVDEPVRMKAHAETFERNAHDSYKSGIKLGRHLRLPETALISFEQLAATHLSMPKKPAGRRLAMLSMLGRETPWLPDAEALTFATPPVDSFGGKFELLVEGLAEWQREGKHLLVCSSEPEKSAEALRGRGLGCVKVAGNGCALVPGEVTICELEMSAGFKLPSADLVCLTAHEIYGWRKLRRRNERGYSPGFALMDLRELSEGDLVVHISHGIGRYVGLSNETVGDVARDYLVIEYANEAKIYVPVTQMDRVQKYIGSEGAAGQIHVLGGKRWESAKKKARGSARMLARELMKLYADREGAEGYRFSEDSAWMKELEAAFRYEETPDQWQAIQDIKSDMEQPKVADRLVCGDVGYGKTEVAIRAAFKAVLDGKQVAVLCPTTVLAHQHLNTFGERLSQYPVQVRMMSRFRTPAEQRAIAAEIKDGSCDIVIGTHRLLMGDITFKDLGLLVIDEEQRFGVAQKEKLKQLRSNVDVLTLTATPIPRTLNMALSGIRDISLINDPPPGRLPIRTWVRERDDDLIREAIKREIERGGQVFFVHNRVKSIEHVAAQVQRMVPEATVAIGHGQMAEDELEQVMLAFYAGEFDVLVCTTIIENGLDLSNANTIIVDDADRMGLSQLYQLRGRVGRSNRQAYAYLLYRYPERMSEIAEERLKAIEEFSELGSGFKVALRDLEIRGAGDVLGGEQSGHMSAVGLDLYCHMLASSVRALKGETVGEGEDGYPGMELPLEAVIPADYVPGENQRIALYRRLASVHDEKELAGMSEEMQDRFGAPPRSVRNLIALAGLKMGCRAVGIVDVGARDGRIRVKLSRKIALGRRERLMFQELYRETINGRRREDTPALRRPLFEATTITFMYDAKDPDAALAGLEEIIERLRERNERLAGSRQRASGE